MLRFRRDHLYIGVETDRLSLVRVRPSFPGRSAHIVDCAEVTCAETTGDTAALHVLEQMLTEKRWQNTQATIVLSDRLARYFIAERPEGARNADEVNMAGTLRFEDVFGESSDAWDIRLDRPPFARRQLGCALPKGFVQELTTVCTGHGIRLTSLVPFAIAEYNRWQASLKDRRGCFVVLGRQGLWVGMRSGNDWACASQYVATASRDEMLQRALVQESLRAAAPGATSDAPVSPVVWLAGDLTDVALRQRLLAPLRTPLGAFAWPGQSAEWSAQYRVALSPVWPACV